MMKALKLVKPHILVMIGAPASGKSEFASKFAQTFHAPYINAKRFESLSEDTAATLDLIYEIVDEIQKTNQTIVYEGITGSRVERTQLAKLARANGYEPLFVWVQTDPLIARGRATRRSRSNPQPMSEQEFDSQFKRFTPPAASESYVVISGMHTYASQAKTVLKRLSEVSSRSANDAERTTGPRPPRRPVIIR